MTLSIDFLKYFWIGPLKSSPNRSKVKFGLRLYLFRYNSENNQGVSG